MPAFTTRQCPGPFLQPHVCPRTAVFLGTSPQAPVQQAVYLSTCACFSHSDTPTKPAYSCRLSPMRGLGANVSSSYLHYCTTLRRAIHMRLKTENRYGSFLQLHHMLFEGECVACRKVMLRRPPTESQGFPCDRAEKSVYYNLHCYLCANMGAYLSAAVIAWVASGG